MEIRIPAKAMRAAQLCTSKDEYRRLLQGVCVSWDKDGAWEIAATDSIKLFNAWSHERLEKPAGSVVIDPRELELKTKDAVIVLDTETMQADICDKNNTLIRLYVLDPIEAQTAYPDVHRLAEDPSDVDAGYIGCISADHLDPFCKIAKILGAKHHPVHFFTPRKGIDQVELRPVIIKWPGVNTSFHCLGLVMPVRL